MVIISLKFDSMIFSLFKIGMNAKNWVCVKIMELVTITKGLTFVCVQMAGRDNIVNKVINNTSI